MRINPVRHKPEYTQTKHTLSASVYIPGHCVSFTFNPHFSDSTAVYFIHHIQL